MERTEESWNVFYGFCCHGCAEPLLIAFDRHESKAPLRFAGPGRFAITCVRCGERNLYGREDFGRFEIGAGGIAATPMPVATTPAHA
jgi:hypothetical protein